MRVRKKQFDVVTLGAATVDIFLRSHNITISKMPQFASGLAECIPIGSKNEAEEMDIATGGGATNAAATFAHLGFKTALCANIGADSFGTLIRKENKGLGITAFLHTNQEKTALSVILSRPGMDRAIITHRGASGQFSIEHFPIRSLKTKWFYATSLRGNIAAIQTLLDYAEETEARVAWNPGAVELALPTKKLLPLFRRTHLLLLNREEALMAIGKDRATMETVMSHLAGTAEYVCITDGANGAWLATESYAWFIRPLPTTPINTTGAGDAFGSGLVAGLLHYQDPVRAARCAMRNAWSVIHHVGAKAGILQNWPTKQQLDAVTVVPW